MLAEPSFYWLTEAAHDPLVATSCCLAQWSFFFSVLILNQNPVPLGVPSIFIHRNEQKRRKFETGESPPSGPTQCQEMMI
ncbi:hypothetical protein GBA52_028875 [Prunus armeniaca]|nr:hypothetical protein GBA52_028875 [Prunus armeniaca]